MNSLKSHEQNLNESVKTLDLLNLLQLISWHSEVQY